MLCFLGGYHKWEQSTAFPTQSTPGLEDWSINTNIPHVRLSAINVCCCGPDIEKLIKEIQQIHKTNIIVLGETGPLKAELVNRLKGNFDVVGSGPKRQDDKKRLGVIIVSTKGQNLELLSETNRTISVKHPSGLIIIDVNFG